MSEMLTLLPELSGIAYIDGTNMVKECHAVRMQDVRYQKYSGFGACSNRKRKKEIVRRRGKSLGSKATGRYPADKLKNGGR